MSDSGGRLLRLLALLGTRPWSTSSELAERLGVTARTIRRDIQSLRGLGYPVESLAGPGGGYGFGRGGRLPPLLLDDDEAVAVAVGLRLVTAASMEGASDSAVRAASKIDQLLAPSLAGRVDALAGATVLLERDRERVGADRLSILADAAHHRRMVRMAYVSGDGAASERVVAPYRLVHARGRWYLVAHDPDRPGWRTFRVDRISSATATRRRSHLPDPPDPAEFVSRSVSVEPYRFAVRVDLAAPADQVRSRIPPTVGVVEEAGDHSILSTGSDDLDAVVGHLVMLGTPFRVLDPPELADRVAAVAAMLASAGRSPGGT
jgi:predicted DNA-binding transcriptional regulator YafY